MADERYVQYLHAERGHVPAGARTGAAGGAACGDLVRISIAVEGDRVADAGADASGCGAALAAASAAVALVRGRPLLEAARAAPGPPAAARGGLRPGSRPAAEPPEAPPPRAVGPPPRHDAQ